MGGGQQMVSGLQDGELIRDMSYNSNEQSSPSSLWIGGLLPTCVGSDQVQDLHTVVHEQ